MNNPTLRTKKVVLVLLALLTILAFTTGCSNEDDGFEDIENWRESFFRVPSREKIILWTKIPISILAVINLGFFLNVANKLLKKDERVDINGILIPFLLSIGIILIVLFPETAADLGNKILPQEVTLDWVLGKLRVTESGKLGDKVYKSWVTATLGTIPVKFSLGIFMLFIANILAMFVSIISRSVRGLIFFISSLFGIGSFLSLWVAYIYYIDDIWPNINFLPVKIEMNLTFVFWTNVLFFICFYTIPVSGFILFPKSWDLKNRVSEEKNNDGLITEKPRRNWDFNGLAVATGAGLGLLTGNKTPDNKNGGSGIANPVRNENGIPLLPAPEIDVIDGEFTVVTPPPSDYDPSNNPNNTDNEPNPNKVHGNTSKSTSKEIPNYKDVNQNPNPSDYPDSNSFSENERVTTKGSTPEIFIPTPSVVNPNSEKGKKSTQPASINKEKPIQRKKNKSLDPATIAAAADIGSLAATALGHPEAAAVVKAVGTGASTYNLAKQQKEEMKNERGEIDPHVKAAALSDVVTLAAEAIDVPFVAKASQIFGTVASTRAVAKQGSSPENKELSDE